MQVQCLLMSPGRDRGVRVHDPKIENRHLRRVELEREFELGSAE